MGGTTFHGDYQSSVIDQYLGSGAVPARACARRCCWRPRRPRSLRPRRHRGPCAGGSVLHLRRDFQTPTSPICSDTTSLDGCGPTRAVVLDRGLRQHDADRGVLGRVHLGCGAFDTASGARGGRDRGVDADLWVGCQARRRRVAGRVVSVDPCSAASAPKADEDGRGAQRS